MEVPQNKDEKILQIFCHSNLKYVHQTGLENISYKAI